MSLWTILCALLCSYSGTGILKLIPQSWEHETVQNVLVWWSIKSCFQWKKELNSSKKKKKKKKIPTYILIYPILQTLWLVNAVRQISLSSIGLPGKVWFSTQLMLYIALGDIRLGCRYSAMETNSMKVLDTVPQLIWRSEVCSDWFCRTLVISAPADPTLWFYVASTLWLSFCDF